MCKHTHTHTQTYITHTKEMQLTESKRGKTVKTYHSIEMLSVASMIIALLRAFLFDLRESPK